MMKGAQPIFIDMKSKVGILMLHGFSSTPDEFREMSSFLSKQGFSCYAPLIAGHGTIPQDLSKTSPEDWTQSAKQAYVDLKKISEKIIIVGNSFGSNLGFWLAKEFNNEQLGIITLDAPILMRYHFWAWLRLYTYGLFIKYYVKSQRIYEADYIDHADDVTYHVIPTKSLRDFLNFIKYETKPHLKDVTLPVLVTHSKQDPVVHPYSAQYIYNHIASQKKKSYWFESRYHGFTVEGRRKEVFEEVLKFIQSII